MTKSVSRPRGYYENIIKSPLLNFSNYPQSIVRRIASRGANGRERIKRKIFVANNYTNTSTKQLIQEDMTLNSMASN